MKYSHIVILYHNGNYNFLKLDNKLNNHILKKYKDICENKFGISFMGFLLRKDNPIDMYKCSKLYYHLENIPSVNICSNCFYNKIK